MSFHGFYATRFTNCHDRSIDYEDRDGGTTKNWEAGLLKEKQVDRSNERIQRDRDSGGDYLEAGLASRKSAEKRKRFSHFSRDSESNSEGYAPSQPATPRLIKFWFLAQR